MDKADAVSARTKVAIDVNLCCSRDCATRWLHQEGELNWFWKAHNAVWRRLFRSSSYVRLDSQVAWDEPHLRLEASHPREQNKRATPQGMLGDDGQSTVRARWLWLRAELLAAEGFPSEGRQVDSKAAVLKALTVRAHRRRLSALSVSQSKSTFYGAFVWVRRARNCKKRRSPARAGGSRGWGVRACREFAGL
jgi:hypothetical protein